LCKLAGSPASWCCTLHRCVAAMLTMPACVALPRRPR
jgi:hypothetical protein